MSFSPIPDVSIESIFDLKPKMLSERGISLLLLDLDNTLIPYSHTTLPSEVGNWMDGFKRDGIELFLVSNTRSNRAETFSKTASIPFVNSAWKPSPKKVFEAMRRMGRGLQDTAIMGDQIFTDVLAGNRAGIFTIVVKPIDVHNFLFKLRYFIELPFRVLSKQKL